MIAAMFPQPHTLSKPRNNQSTVLDSIYSFTFPHLVDAFSHAALC